MECWWFCEAESECLTICSHFALRSKPSSPLLKDASYTSTGNSLSRSSEEGLYEPRYRSGGIIAIAP